MNVVAVKTLTPSAVCFANATSLTEEGTIRVVNIKPAPFPRPFGKGAYLFVCVIRGRGFTYILRLKK